MLFAKTVATRLGTDVLPATVITDRSGVILDVFRGVPTLSDIKRLLQTAE